MATKRMGLILGVIGAWWLAMFIGTHLPPRGVGVPGLWDKVMHFGAYAVLACLLGCWGVVRGQLGWRQAGLVLAVLAVYATVDELTQVPVGRTADVWDFMADLAGAAVGLSIVALAAHRPAPKSLSQPFPERGESDQKEPQAVSAGRSS